jgi:glycerol-3-phosphate O-acyltransferase
MLAPPMSTPAFRPVKEAENRLASFNQERASILDEVHQRVLFSKVEAAQRKKEASLEYVLNDVAYHEIRRLESGPATAREKKRLGAWRGLARQLHGMGDEEKRERLSVLVWEYAKDVAGNFDPRVYRFAKGLLPAALAGILAPQSLTAGLGNLGELHGKVQIDGPLDTLRACADRGTLVVAPTHASHMDSILMGWSFIQAGLPPCTYGAGKNLFSNKFLSFFLHNLGAYRVDRRLRHGLYKDVLKEYSTILLERGYHSLFFPGGTRSRSGAVESKLKLGLLGTGLSAYQNNLGRGAGQRRIFIVPCTTNYQITLEAETLILDYLADEGKSRYIIEDDEFSRLARLFEFAKQTLAMEGALVIRYGAPLDPFGNAVRDDGESIDPHGRVIDPAEYLQGPSGQVEDEPQRNAEYTRGLAEELVRAFRRHSVFMPTQLVSRALFDRVTERARTRDVYRLLRLSESPEVPLRVLIGDVARWQKTFAERGEEGRLPERVAGMPAEHVVGEALHAFRSYHHRPVAERVGDAVVVGDMRLLFYYQNRLAHIEGTRAKKGLVSVPLEAVS